MRGLFQRAVAVDNRAEFGLAKAGNFFLELPRGIASGGSDGLCNSANSAMSCSRQ